jgi:hypothetical protein
VRQIFRQGLDFDFMENFNQITDTGLDCLGYASKFNRYLTLIFLFMSIAKKSAWIGSSVTGSVWTSWISASMSPAPATETFTAELSPASRQIS